MHSAGHTFNIAMDSRFIRGGWEMTSDLTDAILGRDVAGVTAVSGVAAEEARRLTEQWRTNPRWAGVRREYSAEDVVRLRGSVTEEHTLARLGAQRLWKLLHERDYVPALGALTGGQAVQQVRAGLPAIYVSGWQVAADANVAGHGTSTTIPAGRPPGPRTGGRRSRRGGRRTGTAGRPRP